MMDIASVTQKIFGAGGDGSHSGDRGRRVSELKACMVCLRSSKSVRASQRNHDLGKQSKPKLPIIQLSKNRGREFWEVVSSQPLGNGEN